MSIFRAYIINADTGKEVTDHPANGKTWVGTSGNLYRDGAFVQGTASTVTVADFANLYAIKGERKLTAADFDFPVVVKVWGPTHQDWRYLLRDDHNLSDLDRRRAARCVERST